MVKTNSNGLDHFFVHSAIDGNTMYYTTFKTPAHIHLIGKE